MDFWTFYAVLCTIALVNAALLAWRLGAACRTRAWGLGGYGVAACALGTPWVFECTWRCVLPSLYLQRYVVWDTWLNSVLLDRSLACIGELAWTAQIALAVCHLDSQLGRTVWVQACGFLAVLIYVAAEGMSYYNTATTNELWAANEVITDGIAFVFFLPACISLFARLKARPWRYPKVFAVVLALTAIIYPCYNWIVDAKMYMRRYAADQAANKTYMAFWPGIQDAATRRIVTHDTDDWSGDMTWMLVYFSIAAWSGILLMRPPTLEGLTKKYVNKGAGPLLDAQDRASVQKV